jgi:DUF1680 family protein
MIRCCRLTFLLPILILSSCAIVAAQDKFHSLSPGSIQVGGYIGNRMLACIEKNINSTSTSMLIAPFRSRVETRYWQTEFWGKWATAACAAYRYSNNKELLGRLVNSSDSLLHTQTPDGYIGNYRQDRHLQEWDIWGRKYVLLGLLDIFNITGNKKLLVAAEKLADHLVTELQNRNISQFGNFRGMAASSVLEPIVALYRATDKKQYLDFAESIVEGWEKEDGPKLISKSLGEIPVASRFAKPRNWFSYENGQKAYEMMSCYEGLLELYKITGNETYRLAVTKAVKNIVEQEIMITGSGSSLECWYGGKANQAIPAKNMNETCVTATWMKLCGRMLQLTGDPQYADHIEQTFYNALLGAMTPDGASWSKYSELNGHRHFGEMQCGMPLNCCIASGPRGMMVIPKVAVMQDSAGLVVNLFETMKATFDIGKSRVQLAQQSGYPASNIAEINIDPEKNALFELKIRIPAWSDSSIIILNGDTLQRPSAGTYAVIKRKWSRGDKVKLVLDMHGRMIRSNDQHHFAIMYGPLVLAADERVSPGVKYNYCEPVADKKGRIACIQLKPINNSIYFQAGIPVIIAGKQTRIPMINYASAGNTWSPVSGYITWFPRLWDLRQ